MRDKVYCQTCRNYVNFKQNLHSAFLVDHPCCACPNCEGLCKDSSTQVRHLSRMPSWHPFHLCGIFCDGQDGGSSQCAREKRAGPPDVIERLAEIDV